MSIREDYIEFKKQHIDEPFLSDQRYFQAHYGPDLQSQLNRIFKELIDCDRELCNLKERMNAQDGEDD